MFILGEIGSQNTNEEHTGPVVEQKSGKVIWKYWIKLWYYDMKCKVCDFNQFYDKPVFETVSSILS